MQRLIAIVVRVVVVGGAGLVTGWLVNAMTAKGGGANIGAGLISFLVLLLVSLVWGTIDGKRWKSVSPIMLVWFVVALVVAISVVVGIQFHGAGLDTSVLRSDLMSVSPFIFGLVFVPAAIGGSIAARLSPKGARGAKRGTKV